MRINEDEFIAIIPARGGSKGVPRKNIKLLCGFPLIAYTIATCMQSNVISRVVVSTDDQEIADIAKQYGAEVPFIRPQEFATDNSSDISFMRHAIEWFDTNEGRVAEYIVHMRPTTPLRDVMVVDDALLAFKREHTFSSLRSAHKSPESPYKWFLKNEDGTFRSIMEGLDNESANCGRGEFSDVYIPDGYVDVIKTDYVEANGMLHGERMMAFESPMCTEVDTMEEFEYIEYQIKKYNLMPYEYLLNNFKSRTEV